MKKNILYRIQNSYVPLYGSWKTAVLTIKKDVLVIKGISNSQFHFSEIKSISYHLPRLGLGIYIIIEVSNKTIYIKIPIAKYCLGFVCPSDTIKTESLYRKFLEAWLISQQKK